MRPAGAMLEAFVDHQAVHVALAVPDPNLGKDREEDIVQRVRAALDQRDFRRRLDPADAVHHRDAVDHLEVGQRRLHRLPMLRAHVILFEADARAVEAVFADDLAQLGIRRFDIAFMQLDPLDPGIAPGELGGDRVGDDHRCPLPRPEQQHAALAVGQVLQARQRARIDDAGKIGDVHARPQHDRGQVIFVHERIQPVDVGRYGLLAQLHAGALRLLTCRPHRVWFR